MEKTVQQMFAKRRTNYTLGKDVTLSQEEITARIEAVVREVPSANMQSGRIIIAYGSASDTIWQITKRHSPGGRTGRSICQYGKENRFLCCRLRHHSVL